MKKIMIVILAVAMAMAYALPAAAVVNGLTGTVQFDTTGDTAAYSMSNNVYVDFVVNSTVNPQNYGLATLHSSGDRQYRTSESTSIIWFKTHAKGSMSNPDAPTAGFTAQPSGYSAM